MSSLNQAQLNKLERLKKYKGTDAVISSKDFKDDLDKRKDEISSFSSGFEDLDKFSGGFEEGELIIVTGYTGHGKTSFLQSLTENFLEQKVKTLWFSYEMTAAQFFSKFKELPLFYLPKELKGSAMHWIEERILEAIMKYRIKVVMIDHLHFLIDLAQIRHPSLEIGTIVRSLKSMALRYKITLFLIAHTSMPRGDQPPGLENIRDSSFITQEAEATLAI